MLFKKTNVDNEVRFDFHLSPLKWFGVVFAINAVFLPFLLNIIFRIVFSENEFKELKLDLTLLLTNFVLVLIGMIYIIKKLTLRKFLKSGAVGFYLFYFFQKIVGLSVILLVTVIKPVDWQIITVISLVHQLVAHTIAIILIFVFSSSLRLMIKKTFKEKFLWIMAVVSIGFVVILGLNYIISLDELINGEGVPQNQAMYDLMLSTEVGIVLWIFLAVITAIVIEELACRHSIFSLSGNKWLAFSTSVIYFAGMHVELSGDWSRILHCMALSIVLTSTFLYVRGNVTYVIFLHILSNIVAVILSLMKK